MTISRVQWNEYAEAYDLMAEYNPAYQDILDRFISVTTKWNLLPGSQLLEIGAGTGNFSLKAADLLREVTVIHSEPHTAMQEHARRKAASLNLSNVRFLPYTIEQLNFPVGGLSDAILVHVLYVLPEPRSFIKRLSGWLSSGSPVFACDLGRLMDVVDWRRYLVRELVKTHGWLQTLSLLWRGRGIARANYQIRAEQKAGRYWLHSGDELSEAFKDAGFTIETQETAYRGYSDLLVCKKI